MNICTGRTTTSAFEQSEMKTGSVEVFQDSVTFIIAFSSASHKAIALNFGTAPLRSQHVLSRT